MYCFVYYFYSKGSERQFPLIRVLLNLYTPVEEDSVAGAEDLEVSAPEWPLERVRQR